jgi:hypothetical protein
MNESNLHEQPMADAVPFRRAWLWLLLAGLLLAGPGTAWAATVGYYNLTLPPGYSLLTLHMLISPPIPATPTNSCVGDLPLDTNLTYTVFAMDAGGFKAANYLNGWSDLNLPVTPGSAWFFKNPYPTNLVTMIIGTVAEGTNCLPAGLCACGSFLPVSSALIYSWHDFPAAHGDLFYFFDPVSATYEMLEYEGINLWWSAARFDYVPEPYLGLGEGFWVRKQQPANWVESVITGYLSLAQPQLVAQVGQVNFFTFNATNAACGRVFDADGTSPLGTNCLGQLYAGNGNNESSLVALGAPVEFLGGTAAGYLRSGVVSAPFASGGQQIYIQLRAWKKADGPTYEAALGSGGLVGKSAVTPFTAHATIEGGNPGLPPPDVNTFPNFQLRAMPPVITLQPSGQTVTAGHDATFAVTATGMAPLSYQWRFNGNPRTGATTNTCTIPHALSANQGSYDVVVTNYNGSVTSQIATLTVLPRPALTNIWRGGGPDQHWSTATNWSSGGCPLAQDAVLFTSAAATTTSNVNNVVDGEFTAMGGPIASLQYANSNSAHTTLIAPGQSLTVTGPLTAGTETPNDIILTNTITGPGAALIITNPSADLVVRQGPAFAGSVTNRTTLDLSGLDTFKATVGRVLVGVGTGVGTMDWATGRLILARANVIVARSATAPALDVGETGTMSNGGSTVLLGQTNAIFADTITVGRGPARWNILEFNPAWLGSGMPVVCFRGADGQSRVGTFAISDGASTGGANAQAAVNLSGGLVDGLVDTLIVGRSTDATPALGNRSSSGTLIFDRGTLDVNVLRIGWNTTSNNNYGIGAVIANGSARLVIHTVMELGRASGGAGTDRTHGTLSVFGGTVCAAVIQANFGGTDNAVGLSNGTLVVSAAIGPGVNRLGLTNSTLELPALATQPSAIVTNLATGAGTNKLNVGSLPTIGALPAQFTLIKYSGSIAGAGFNFALGTPPQSGGVLFQGFISNNVANSSVDLVLTSARPPPTLADPVRLPDGTFHFGFTSALAASFSVMAATNVDLPLSNWSYLGAPIESPPGCFQFTDPAATNYPLRFYRLRCP